MAPEAAVPLQRLQPQLSLRDQETVGAGIPLVPSLPCPECAWTHRPTTAAEPPGRSGETSLVSITLARGPSVTLPRSMAWVQPHAGSRLGCWETQPGHKSGQWLFLILSEAQPMQGRNGGGLPTFPTIAGDHGGQRKRRLALTTCWSERGDRSIFMRHRQSRSSALAQQAAWRSLCPVFSPHRLQLWREQPCSFPCPQRAGNTRHEKGWEQGAVPAPCSQAPLKRCARKSGSH